jgi:hypothetical protein
MLNFVYPILVFSYSKYDLNEYSLFWILSYIYGNIHSINLIKSAPILFLR